MKFSGNVDNGTRNRRLNVGDVLDYHLAPGLFWRILVAHAPTNELLGGGLRSPSAFLVTPETTSSSDGTVSWSAPVHQYSKVKSSDTRDQQKQDLRGLCGTTTKTVATVSPRDQSFRTGDWPRQMSPSWTMVCLHTLQCLVFLKVFTRNVWEWRASNSSGCRTTTRQKRWNVSVKVLWPDLCSMSPGGVRHFRGLCRCFPT